MLTMFVDSSSTIGSALIWAVRATTIASGAMSSFSVFS